MVKEIYDGKVDLKNPKQAKVEALTDNKGLWETLNNTRQKIIEEFNCPNERNGGKGQS